VPAVLRTARRTAAVLAAATTLALAGCGAGRAPSPSAPPRSAPVATVAASCAPVAGFGCEWAPRFAAVQRRIEERPAVPGFVAVTVTDRVTGATWTAGDVDRPGWTASTIKVAIAADLRERGGLSAADRADMDAMLHTSDNAATDRLWRRHGGDAMLDRFRTRLGMRSLAFQPGERYVVAVTDQQPSPGSLPGGVHAVSDLVALLFGEPVPAPVTVPEPDD
jgi:beta-lactamase class A